MSKNIENKCKKTTNKLGHIFPSVKHTPFQFNGGMCFGFFVCVSIDCVLYHTHSLRVDFVLLLIRICTKHCLIKHDWSCMVCTVSGGLLCSLQINIIWHIVSEYTLHEFTAGMPAHVRICVAHMCVRSARSIAKYYETQPH